MGSFSNNVIFTIICHLNPFPKNQYKIFNYFPNMMTVEITILICYICESKILRLAAFLWGAGIYVLTL